MPVSTRRELDLQHGSEEDNDPLALDPAETPAIDTQTPNLPQTTERPDKPFDELDQYELSAFLEQNGFGTGIIGLVVHQNLDGETLAMYVAVPQYLEIAQAELQLSSVLEAIKLKKIVNSQSSQRNSKSAVQADDPDRRPREDTSRFDLKLVPKLPDTNGKSSFDPRQWRAYGVSVIGFVHLSDPALARYYEQSFEGSLTNVHSVKLSAVQQRLDLYVANSILHDPPRVVRDLLVCKPKYTLNGVQSGLVITSSVTKIVFKASDAVKDAIYDRCVATQPVSDPHELKSAVQSLRENLDQLHRQGGSTDNSLQMVLLRRLVKNLIQQPQLTQPLTIPYNDLIKNHPEDPEELINFLDSKGDEFKKTMPKLQTAPREAMGADYKAKTITLGGICIPDRERNACPDRSTCKGKHVHTGKVCINKWMGKVGLCSNWANCHDTHPYDESKWGISRRDAVEKYKAEMKANP